jgi:hypothetical protein
MCVCVCVYMCVLRAGPQTVLIAQRNAVAVEEVARAQAQGYRKTALLYGGLHGPDLDARLQREMGFKLKCVEWVTGKHVNREHMNKRMQSG